MTLDALRLEVPDILNEEASSLADLNELPSPYEMDLVPGGGLAVLRAVIAGIRDQLDHHFLDEVSGLGAPTLENLCVFIFAQVHKQVPQVSAVAVSRAAGDRCVYRPQA